MTNNAPPVRRFWGWGYENAGPDAAVLAATEAGLKYFLGLKDFTPMERPRLDNVTLPPARVEIPSKLSECASASAFERALHTYGRSYRDLARTVRGDFSPAPDWVAHPRSEEELVQVLAHCDRENIAVVPFGGGSSVCGGVEPEMGPKHKGVISLDLGQLDRVVEIDRVSRAARIQAGAFGPALEDQLRPHGLTLRHYPQSFEFSTLGGWIATRSGGHYATVVTHIDELVESLRVVTPTGVVETRRLPGSGAGPNPDRLFIGSEGILGVITEAWMRITERPKFRANFSATFERFERGASAVRALAQSGLQPQNCRLLDAMEAMMNGAGGGDRAVLLVAFESSDHPVEHSLRRAAELCRDFGGEVPEEALAQRSTETGAREGASGAFRAAFLRAPYLRDELVLRGVFVETFETAVTWDRFEALVAAVRAAAERAAVDTGGGKCVVTCRTTHAYPDGVAPYFTVLAPAARGQELAQWDTVKRAITDAMLENGGTTTHHHAVGRDFRPYYERERPEAFARVLAAAKATLDPNGILNPGVLLPA